MTTPTPADALTPEEQVIREWVAAMTRESGAPLPPSLRRAEPLPRRRVLPVVQTLLDIIDELREHWPGPLIIGTDDSPEWRAALSPQPEVSVTPGLRALVDVERLGPVNDRVNRGLGEGLLAATKWRDALIEVGAMLDDLINDAALAESPVTPDLRAAWVEGWMQGAGQMTTWGPEALHSEAVRQYDRRRALASPDPEAGS